jgi:hypothetical protein
MLVGFGLGVVSGCTSESTVSANWRARRLPGPLTERRLRGHVPGAHGCSLFGGQGLVLQRFTVPGHVLDPKVALSRERVMGWAVKGQVGGGVRGQLPEGVSVVKL